MCGRFLDKYLITVRDKYTNRTLGDFEPYELGLSQRTADVVIFKDGDKAVAYNWKGEKIIESDEHYETFQEVVEPISRGHIFIAPTQSESDYYLLSDQVKIFGKDGLVISGGGFGTYILLDEGTNKSPFKIGGCTRVLIKDLRINGNRTKNSAGHGLEIDGTTEKTSVVWIERVTIEGCKQYGVHAYGNKAGGIHIVRCQIQNNEGGGIYFKDVHSNCVISKCWIGNSVEDGNPFASGSGARLENCRSIIIEGNDIFGNTYGINIIDSFNIRILNGNHINLNKDYGIYIHPSSSSVYDILIEGNVIYSNGQRLIDNPSATYMAGILIDSGTYITIRGNHVLNALGWFTDPYIDDSQFYGIREINTADYNIIEGNITRNNKTANIETVGTNTISSNNIT